MSITVGRSYAFNNPQDLKDMIKDYRDIMIENERIYEQNKKHFEDAISDAEQRLKNFETQANTEKGLPEVTQDETESGEKIEEPLTDEELMERGIYPII